MSVAQIGYADRKPRLTSALTPASTITTIRPQLRPCSRAMPARIETTPMIRWTQPQTV